MVTVVAERHSDPHIESANESVKVSIIYADGRREVIGFTNGTPEGAAKGRRDVNLTVNTNGLLPN
jgi:hypothetical protein